MSTITKEFTKEQLQQIIETDHVQCGEASSLARVALASLEAEAVHQVYGNSDDTWSDVDEDEMIRLSSDGEDTRTLYTAPPAPVAVPECFKRLLHHAYGMTMGHDWNKGTMAGHHRAKLCQAVDECRAAMLQGADGTLTNEGTMQLSGNSEQIEPVSNRDELPLDYLQGHKDGLEWAAQLAEANHPQTGDWLYDDPIELARAIRKGPDIPEFKSVPVDEDDNFYSWFGRFWYENYQKNNYTTSAKQMLGTMAEFAYRAGRESAALAANSPETPDGWQLVPKEPTAAMNKAGWDAMNEHDAINPTYRAILAAAPQQEVK